MIMFFFSSNSVVYFSLFVVIPDEVIKRYDTMNANKNNKPFGLTHVFFNFS